MPILQKQFFKEKQISWKLISVKNPLPVRKQLEQDRAYNAEPGFVQLLQEALPNKIAKLHVKLNKYYIVDLNIVLIVQLKKYMTCITSI